MPESDQYEVLEKIGHGSFGVIRKVRRRTDSMILCRKEISYLKMSQKEREQLHAEFQILSTLSHPNIVGYYHREHLKATQDLHLYMEYCGNGDLGRVIRNLTEKNQYAEEAFVWSTFSQLVTALYRCHYGVDPPEVGKTVLGLGATAKPKAPTGGMTILHRDLKPENVFLGEDNSVKLGDFGLSKVMASHDFASTYVGTPFYMSPEICAAEKYTLKSDIWSLGCIIYELCSREPPFNAKSHFQLVQKIKEGKIAPLPAIYSQELMGVIKDCLRVNPDRRPDTAALLNLPIVRLMRKEKEVVDFGKILKSKEDSLEKRLRKAQEDHERSKVMMRAEIDNQLRREWEVKARLEIDRHVQREIEELQKKFEQEVLARVKAELESHKKTVTFNDQNREFSSSSSKSDFPSSFPNSSIGTTSADGEFPSTTDITDISDDGRDQPVEVIKKTRNPLDRAQTMFVAVSNSPMDVDLRSPSPIQISSLSLSPRRNGATKAPSANTDNIFTANTQSGSQWDELRDNSMDMNSDSDDDMPIPSPTRNVRSVKNPFTSKTRPNLLAQKTTGNIHFISKQTGLPVMMNTKTSSQELQGLNQTQAAQGGIRRTPSNRALQERSGSPNRRLSKIPSAANLHHNSSGSEGGPVPGTRKSSLTKPGDAAQQQQQQQQQASANKGAAKTTFIRGRTLVELQQARAGGRPASAVEPGTNINTSPKRPFREHAAAGNRGTASEPAAVWDPERDEMPSPFLVRRKMER